MRLDDFNFPDGFELPEALNHYINRKIYEHLTNDVDLQITCHHIKAVLEDFALDPTIMLNNILLSYILRYYHARISLRRQEWQSEKITASANELLGLK